MLRAVLSFFCFLLGVHLEFCDLEWGVEKEPSLKWVSKCFLRMWFFSVIKFEGWVSGLSSSPPIRFLALLIPLPSVSVVMGVISVSGGGSSTLSYYSVWKQAGERLPP